MRIQILTIFPELFAPFLATSLVGRAIAEARMTVDVHDLRTFTADKHRSVDDEPYGGGGGMVMTAQPWFDAIAAVGAPNAADAPPPWRILLSPQGTPLDDRNVRRLAAKRDLLLLCGRYEGIDERVRLRAVDEEISIGDYVLSGGELPAMVLIEALSRQVPGVVGLADSVDQDSFRHGLLDYPHYTRPREIAGLAVPDVLLSGDHARINAWRRREALRATVIKRPDLLAAMPPDHALRREADHLAARLGRTLPTARTPDPARRGRAGLASHPTDPNNETSSPAFHG
ncbi:MAG: tRNA (guanosine(37)-N1)-methyltransferase TrmD [Acidobacteriota bacterium]